VTLVTPSCRKNLRGHVQTVPGNKRAKFEVRSCKRFEAIYRSQYNDVIIIVTSRLLHCAHTEWQTEPRNEVKTLYPPSSLHYTWRGLSEIEMILFQKLSLGIWRPSSAPPWRPLCVGARKQCIRLPPVVTPLFR